MRRSLVLLVLVLTFGVSSAGCDDAAITCSHFDSYVSECFSSCAGASWRCVSHYDSLSVSLQEKLDRCSDCLDTASCSQDCYVSEESCFFLLSVHLGLSACW